MAHTLTIDVPETVHHSLERWAAHHGTTPEAQARDWVARRVIERENDPLLRWAGAIDSDVAERHDQYLGQALRQEVRDDPP
jgi:plasmid stability protein